MLYKCAACGKEADAGIGWEWIFVGFDSGDADKISAFLHCSDCKHKFDKYRRDKERVKRGTWVRSDIDSEGWVCSVCGAGCWYYDYEATVCRSRYCPTCGAKMDRG